MAEQVVKEYLIELTQDLTSIAKPFAHLEILGNKVLRGCEINVRRSSHDLSGIILSVDDHGEIEKFSNVRPLHPLHSAIERAANFFLHE